MKKELFNPRTVERLCSKVKLTAKQKAAAKDWLYLLEQGKLKDEKLNYLKFADIILKDLLGYDIRDIDHEAGYIEFPIKDKTGKTVLGIEAKGTKTKDLFGEQSGYRDGQQTPINQVWTYIGKLELTYGIATNYKHFVLLTRDKGLSAFHFFDFEDIRGNENKLKEFVAIFSKEQIIDKGFIEDLEEASIIEERNFTKEFYKLFHETRLMLLNDFQENGISKEDSLRYAQVFLNRLMFVFFAEDTNKLKRRIFEDLVIDALKAESLISSHSSIVANTIKTLFRKLNDGSKEPHDIYGFDGELFKEPIPPQVFFNDFRDAKFFKEIYQYSKLKKEPELDEHSQKIFDKYKNKINPIIKNLLILASFDFNTEVTVNILGHIFEQSLNDLEDLKEGKKTKRKKEGIFYTPEYITDYICRNTIIPYMSKGKAKTPRDLVLEHAKNISELESKFKDIKILDPACGSGAFLIKATDIMLEIHKEIQLFKQDEGSYTAIKRGRKKKKDEGQLMLVKWHEEDEARKIIENSIYGVDINEESVEITKLSMFLKIARGKKKLINLSKNIKCGNSLIDDKEVDKEHAFNWDKEFPFKFDVVIGNPPYVRVQKLRHEEIDWFKINKKVAHKRIDISIMFFELGKSLLNEGGLLSFIASNQFLVAEYGRKARKFILDNFRIIRMVDFGDLKVFEDALTYVSIFTLQNDSPKNFEFLRIEDLDTARKCNYSDFIKIDVNSLTDDAWSLKDKEGNKILEKIEDNKRLDSGIGKCWYGIVTGSDEVFMLDKAHAELEKDILLPLIRANDCQRFGYVDFSKYVIYPYIKQKEKTLLMSVDVLKSKYPKCYKYLCDRKNMLEKRKDSRKTFEESENWYSLTRFGQLQVFEREKIVFPGETKHNKFGIDNNKAGYSGARVFSITVEDEDYSIFFILALLNSNVIEYYLHSVAPLKQGGYRSYSSTIIDTVPIVECSKKDQKNLIILTESILKLNTQSQDFKRKFLNRVATLIANKSGDVDFKPTKKIEQFFDLDFAGFLSELSKKKISLSLKEQDEWEDYFNQYKKEILNLKEKINKTDEEIDDIVYKLYGITDEEKKVIEESLK